MKQRCDDVDLSFSSGGNNVLSLIIIIIFIITAGYVKIHLRACRYAVTRDADVACGVFCCALSLLLMIKIIYQNRYGSGTGFEKLVSLKVVSGKTVPSPKLSWIFIIRSPRLNLMTEMLRSVALTAWISCANCMFTL